MIGDFERADGDAAVDVDDRLLIGGLLSPAAGPPTETVTHWGAWSR